MNPSRSLLERECGQPNALVRVGRQLFEDANHAKVRRERGYFQPRARPEDEWAKEFFAEFGGVNERAPSTFSMHGLLDEANRLEEAGHSGFLPPRSNSSRNYDQPSQEWAQEFLLNGGAAGGHDSLLDAPWHGAVAEPMALKWSVDYLTDAEKALGSDINAVASPMMNEKFSEVDAWNSEVHRVQTGPHDDAIEEDQKMPSAYINFGKLFLAATNSLANDNKVDHVTRSQCNGILAKIRSYDSEGATVQFEAATDEFCALFLSWLQLASEEAAKHEEDLALAYDIFKKIFEEKFGPILKQMIITKAMSNSEEI